MWIILAKNASVDAALKIVSLQGMRSLLGNLRLIDPRLIDPKSSGPEVDLLSGVQCIIKDVLFQEGIYTVHAHR